jgi:hypothetical protein
MVEDHVCMRVVSVKDKGSREKKMAAYEPAQWGAMIHRAFCIKKNCPVPGCVPKPDDQCEAIWSSAINMQTVHLPLRIHHCKKKAVGTVRYANGGDQRMCEEHEDMWKRGGCS